MNKIIIEHHSIFEIVWTIYIVYTEINRSIILNYFSIPIY